MNVPDVSPELPPLHWRAALRLLGRLPQGALSRGFGAIADVPIPRSARSAVIGTFARSVGIDVSEAEKPIAEYSSINDFFVRRLRPGARAVRGDESTPVSPVDGVVGQLGLIERGVLMQAKGRHYTAASLLADDKAAKAYSGGSFITIYLSPRHYHRIHSPCTGNITHADHIPGALLPVNQPAVMHIDGLFPRNERLVCFMRTTRGEVATVAVGAYNVGRISAAFDVTWRDGGHVSNRAGAVRDVRRYQPPLPVAQGAEIMAFHLGSTIVMLFEQQVSFMPDVKPGADILMGAPLGRFG